MSFIVFYSLNFGKKRILSAILLFILATFSVDYVYAIEPNTVSNNLFRLGRFIQENPIIYFINNRDQIIAGLVGGFTFASLLRRAGPLRFPRLTDTLNTVTGTAGILAAAATYEFYNQGQNQRLITGQVNAQTLRDIEHRWDTESY